MKLRSNKNGLRITSVALLVFAPLFLAAPASASTQWTGTNINAVNNCIQFDYRGGSASTIFTAPEGSNGTLSITVNNMVSNRIGAGSPIYDTWSLSTANFAQSGTTEGSFEFSVPFTGSITLNATGKDEGFWAGWYGPTICATSSYVVPAPVWQHSANEGWLLSATAPEGKLFESATARYEAFDTDCGIDVSAIVSAQFAGKSESSISADNGVFGDPCPGWYKKLVVNFTYSNVEVAPEPAPSPAPEPTVEPTPEPAVTESVRPEEPVTESVRPEPTPAPTQEPQPAPQPVDPEPLPPVVVPEPEEPVVEPEPEPTVSPEEEPAPAPEEAEKPAEEPVQEVVDETPAPEQSSPPVATEPTVEDILDLAPEELTEAQVELLVEHAEEVLATAEQGSPAYQEALEQLAVAAEADDAELPEELAAIPVLGEVMGAALEVFNNLGNIGADMAPEQRERAEETVVAAVVVGQVAQTAMAAAASAGSVAAGGATRKVK